MYIIDHSSIVAGLATAQPRAAETDDREQVRAPSRAGKRRQEAVAHARLVRQLPELAAEEGRPLPLWTRALRADQSVAEALLRLTHDERDMMRRWGRGHLVIEAAAAAGVGITVGQVLFETARLKVGAVSPTHASTFAARAGLASARRIHPDALTLHERQLLTLHAEGFSGTELETAYGSGVVERFSDISRKLGVASIGQAAKAALHAKAISVQERWFVPTFRQLQPIEQRVLRLLAEGRAHAQTKEEMGAALNVADVAAGALDKLGLETLWQATRVLTALNVIPTPELTAEEKRRLALLTHEQRRCFALLGGGAPIEAIAEELTTSVRVARSRLDALYEVLQVETPAAAALLAIRAGLAPLDALPTPLPRELHRPLTHRFKVWELDVLELLAQGQSRADIAATMKLTQNTVERRLRSVYFKLGAKDATRALAQAYRHGLIEPRLPAALIDALSPTETTFLERILAGETHEKAAEGLDVSAPTLAARVRRNLGVSARNSSEAAHALVARALAAGFDPGPSTVTRWGRFEDLSEPHQGALFETLSKPPVATHSPVLVSEALSLLDIDSPLELPALLDAEGKLPALTPAARARVRRLPDEAFQALSALANGRPLVCVAQEHGVTTRVFLSEARRWCHLLGVPTLVGAVACVVARGHDLHADVSYAAEEAAAPRFAASGSGTPST